MRLRLNPTADVNIKHSSPARKLQKPEIPANLTPKTQQSLTPQPAPSYFSLPLRNHVSAVEITGLGLRLTALGLNLETISKHSTIYTDKACPQNSILVTWAT